MNGEMYIIWVDGNFVGVTEEEDYCWDIVGDAVNGVTKPILDDDIPDRVEINKINVNRYVTERNNICDKLSNFSVLCGSSSQVEDTLNHMNNTQLEKERAEAKIRAMAL